MTLPTDDNICPVAESAEVELTYDQFQAMLQAPVHLVFPDREITVSRAEWDQTFGQFHIVDPIEELLDRCGETLSPAQEQELERLLQAEFDSRPCDSDDDLDPDASEALALANEEGSLHNILHVFRHPSFPEGRKTIVGDALRASLGMTFRVGVYRAEWSPQGTPYDRDYSIDGTPNQRPYTVRPAWTDYARPGGEREIALTDLAEKWAKGFATHFPPLAAAFPRWCRQAGFDKPQDAKRHLVLSGIVLSLARLDEPLSRQWRTEDRRFEDWHSILDVPREVSTARALRAVDHEKFAEWLKRQTMMAAKAEILTEGNSELHRRTADVFAAAHSLPDAETYLDEHVLRKVTPAQRRLLEARLRDLRRDPKSKMADTARRVDMSPVTARRHLQLIKERLKV